MKIPRNPLEILGLFTNGVICSFLLVLLGLNSIAAQEAANNEAPTTGASAKVVERSSALQIGPRSGLPLPRFVSLKADKVNMRRGPGKEHPVLWVYKRRGMPLEVIEEYDTWRRVRDVDGAEGWIAVSMLSPNRTGMVRALQPLAESNSWALHNKPDANSEIVAEVEPGVIAIVRRCPDVWCEVKADRLSGWIDRAALWGIYDSETLN